VHIAVALDDEIEYPEVADFNGPLIRGVIEPIEERREEPSAVQRVAELLRRTLAYDGPDGERMRDQLGLYMIERWDSDEFVARLTEEAPDVVALVREIYPADWVRPRQA
jgi:hypothetical protein